MRLYLLCFIFLLSCKSSVIKLTDQKENSKSDTVLTKSRSLKHTDVNTKDTAIKIIDNDTILLPNGYRAFRFKQHAKFSDFPADTFVVLSPKPLDFESNKDSKLYRTMIKTNYKDQGTNFAGHYCFMYWGCGSPCTMSFIVDRLTGKIYSGPSVGFGYKFLKNSKMLILNPIDEIDMFHPKPDFYLDVPYDIPEILIWNENDKKFNKL